MTFLVKCHNEDCLSNPDNREDFVERLEALGGALERARVLPGARPAAEVMPARWPGPVVRLDKLRGDHEARRYLASRGFDPARVGRVYGVAYCEESIWRLARGRLIIPVFEQGKLKGWQARYVGELPWKGPEKKKDLPPKYFTCPGMERSRLLYNLDRARAYRTGVIVEGVTDVWRFGPMAVCLFGSAMTDHQQRAFLAAFRRRTAVLLLDPEEFDSAGTRRLARALTQAMPGAFAAVKLPSGTDPGSLDRPFLRDYVARRAGDQGVKVDYRKSE